jgi:hypothetical protein
MVVPVAALTPATAHAHGGGIEIVVLLSVIAGLVGGALVALLPARWHKPTIIGLVSLGLLGVVIKVFSGSSTDQNAAALLLVMVLVTVVLGLPASLAFLATYSFVVPIKTQVSMFRSKKLVLPGRRPPK